MPGASYLPSLGRDEDPFLSPLQNIVPFPSGETYTASTTWSGVDTEAALLALVSSPNLQEATQLDRQGLLRRFNVRWTPQSALKDCQLRSSFS
jgi:protein EFR3